MVSFFVRKEKQMGWETEVAKVKGSSYIPASYTYTNPVKEVWTGWKSVPKTIPKPEQQKKEEEKKKKEEKKTIAEEPIVEKPIVQGGGAGYALPQYSLPEINLPIPDLNWQPTAEMLAQYLQQGQTRAATVINPQVSAVLQALQRFQTEAQNQRNEINPRYTNMSLALANVIKNQMLQPGIDNLIRRGAVESGNLDQLYENTGRYETEQRGAVESERNNILNALANQVMAKEQETSDAQTSLEGLRGKYTDVYSQEAEQTAWDRFLNEKQSTFQNQLAKAQLENAVAAAIAEQQYRAALLAQQDRQFGFESGLAEKKFGLEQALANYSMRPRGVGETPTVQGQSPYEIAKLREMELNNQITEMTLQMMTEAMNAGKNKTTTTSSQPMDYYSYLNKRGIGR